MKATNYIDNTATIHPTAIIYPNVFIGKNVYIGAYSVIGAPPEHREYWDKEPIETTVYIEDDVRITTHVTVDAGTFRTTTIKQGSVLLSKSHVGHDAIIHKYCTISCGALIGGECVIERFTNIGLNATIHQRVIIPADCMIGMSGVVTKKSILQESMKYVGNPVRCIGQNIKK